MIALLSCTLPHPREPQNRAQPCVRQHDAWALSQCSSEIPRELWKQAPGLHSGHVEAETLMLSSALQVMVLKFILALASTDHCGRELSKSVGCALSLRSLPHKQRDKTHLYAVNLIIPSSVFKQCLCAYLHYGFCFIELETFISPSPLSALGEPSEGRQGLCSFVLGRFILTII